MQTYFYAIADFIQQQLRGNEIFLSYFSGERSDFVRFNQGKVRQPGSVEQRFLTVELVQGQRHATVELGLTGEMAIDQAQLLDLLGGLRDQLNHLVDDPYLLYSEQVNSTESLGENRLPEISQVLGEIMQAAQGHDLVGLYAAGGIFRGFANSLGQRNWHSSYNFNFDWSLYHQRDKAVKAGYAGLMWDSEEFGNTVQQVKSQLEILQRPAHTLAPGRYRVYLAPAALAEIIQLLGWGGFSVRGQKTKESALLTMMEHGTALNSQVNLFENTREGIAPGFEKKGFIKPAQVSLIEHGRHHSALVSPRSAKEYGMATNGAEENEEPVSLDLGAGNFPRAQVLSTLDKGIYINNLWYLNYSDRMAGRLTGMTRFATFWVEHGEIVAPLNVMRFDETVYHILGEQLLALTTEREFIVETDTYEVRSMKSIRLPGAMVNEFTLTL